MLVFLLGNSNPMQVVQYNLKPYNVYFKCVWQNLDFLHKRSLVLIWHLFHFLVCRQSAKAKRAAILFKKKQFISSLDFVYWKMNIISYPIKRLEK